MNRLFLTMAFFWLLVQPAGAAVQLHSFLLSGSQAPGAPAGLSFTDFSLATINLHGQISFWGELSNGRAGIWSNSTGALEAVAIEGNPAPGTPARLYSTILPGGIGDNGHSAFTASLSGGASQVGAFVGTAGSVQNVARTGGPVPGYPSGSYFTSVSWPSGYQGGFSSPAISPGGAIAFYSGTSIPETQEERIGIWTNRSGTIAPAVETEQPAPDYPVGSWITSIGGLSVGVEPTINGMGRVAFTASVALPGGTSSDRVVYVERDIGIRTAASTSSAVPGADPSTRFQRFEEPSLNNDGNVAFTATLHGPTITTANDTGVWSTSGETLHQTAREGDSAPGTDLGVVFSGFQRVTEISGDNRVLVHGTLSGPGIDPTRDSGLWMERSGILEMVFQEGMQAPGLDPGLVLVEPIPSFGIVTGFAMNASGKLVFIYDFGPGNGAVSGNGVFMANDAGQLDAVAWTGQTVEALPGVFKTINRLSILDYGENEGGQNDATCLNDRDQLVISARYTDGTRGILMATIPEPASFIVLLLAACFLRRQSNRAFID